MQRGWCYAVCVGAATVVIAAACTGGETPPTAKSSCSTGPPYSEDAAFPSQPPSRDVTETCTPRCDAGPTAGAAMYYLYELPSGACTADGERCGMEVRRLCPGGTLRRVDGMECTCAAGSWRCAITSPGGGSCALVTEGGISDAE